MKLFKKMMASFVVLAVVVGAVCLTGCSFKGKEYAYASTTITVITKTETDSEGKVTVTETKDLTMEEYYLYAYKNIALDKLSENELTEEEKKGLEKWIETTLSAVNSKYSRMKKSTLKFNSKELVVSTVEENKWTGTKEVQSYIFEYEKSGDEYRVQESFGNKNDYAEMYTERVVTVDANKNIVYRIATDFESDSAVTVKAVYSINVVYAKVK